MKCQENRQRIHSYLDDELSAQEERVLYSHMAVCNTCQFDMDQARNLQDLLQETITHVEPPQDFAQQIMANLPSKTDADAQAQAQVFAEQNFFEEESATEEAIKEGIGNVKETKKNFKFSSRWIGMAAGVVFAVFAVLGFNQVTNVAIGPTEEAGFYVNINFTPNTIIPSTMIGHRRDQQSGNGENFEENNLPGYAVNLQPDGQVGADPESAPAANIDDSNNEIDGETVQNEDTNIGSNEGDGRAPSNNNNEGMNSAIASNQNGQVTEIEEEVVLTSPFIIANNPTSTVTLTPVVENVLGATWGPSGNSLLYLIQDNGNIRAYESQINGEWKRSIGSYSAVGVWSPNRDYMAYIQTVDGESTVWIEGRGGKRNLTPKETEAESEGTNWAYNPIWSSRNEIAFLTDRFGGTDIMVVDMAGNSRRVTSSGDRKDNLVWSPDGTQIAYFRSWEDGGSMLGEIVVVSASGGTPRSITPNVRTSNMVATWSPDGRFLAVNVTGGQQGVWVAGTDGSSWDRRTTRGGGGTIEWSPDGQKIAFSDSQGMLHIWIWTNVDILPVPLMGGQMANASVEWSRDSNEILLKQPVSGNTKSVWIGTLPRSTNAH